MTRTIDRIPAWISRSLFALAAACSLATPQTASAVTYTCPIPKASSFTSRDQNLIDLSGNIHAFYDQQCSSIQGAIPHIQAQAAAFQKEGDRLAEQGYQKQISHDSMEGYCSDRLREHARYLTSVMVPRFSDALRLPSVTCAVAVQPETPPSNQYAKSETTGYVKSYRAEAVNGTASAETESTLQSAAAKIWDLW